MKRELSNEDYTDKKNILSQMLKDDLNGLGIFNWGGGVTLERWKVTYFDENGIEFNTKINNI